MSVRDRDGLGLLVGEGLALGDGVGDAVLAGVKLTITKAEGDALQDGGRVVVLDCVGATVPVLVFVLVGDNDCVGVRMGVAVALTDVLLGTVPDAV